MSERNLYRRGIWSQWGLDKWDGTQMGFLCKWGGLHGTKIHNPIQKAIYKWDSYVSGTLNSARSMSQLLSPYCTCRIVKVQCVSYCIQKQSLSRWDSSPETHEHTSTVLLSMENIELCSVSWMSKRILLTSRFDPHYPLSLLQLL